MSHFRSSRLLSSALRFALIPFILNCLLVGQQVCTDLRTDFGPILFTDTPLGFLTTQNFRFRIIDFLYD